MLVRVGTITATVCRRLAARALVGEPDNELGNGRHRIFLPKANRDKPVAMPLGVVDGRESAVDLRKRASASFHKQQASSARGIVHGAHDHGDLPDLTLELLELRKARDAGPVEASKGRART